MTSLNVAVVGGGLPVDPIDIADFEAILGELSPAVKAPGAIMQAQGNQFTVVFLPHRASVQVDVPFPEGAEGKVLDAMRFYLKEYAGPRSVTGLGHNFSGELDSGGATGRHVVDSLLNKEKLNSVLNAEPGSASMTIQFVRGTETRCQLLLSVRDADAHVVDWSFNFHYDLRQPESLDVFDALDQFSASRVFAEESVGAMQKWKED